MTKLEKMIIDSRNAHKEIKPVLKESAENRWEKKKVYRYVTIHDCNSMEHVSLNGIGTIKTCTFDGSNCIQLTTNTNIEDVRPRPNSSLQIDIDKQDWSDYNRVSMWVYPESKGFQNFYFHFTLYNENSQNQTHAPSLTPNVWNHITWEIPDLKKDKVIKIGMGPLLMGCPDEAVPEINVYFRDLQMQKVDADYYEGWEVQDRLAYCHCGYFKDAQKIALTQTAHADFFSLFDEIGKEVYYNKLDIIKTDIGNFYALDFTAFNQEGYYYLQIDDRQTPLFVIGDNPYQSSIWKSINFLRMLRCGDDISEVHSQCHLNNYTLHPDGRMLPNHGGWHDAGDVSQFEICTAEMAHAILDLAEKVIDKDQTLSERLLEEARWGINWLLRTRFGDGYRALAVHYSIWRSNIVNNDRFKVDNPIYENNVAENGPFENFCAAAVEAVAARLFNKEDKVFADWCRRSAIEDFQFGVLGYKQGLYTRRWGPGADAQVCGEGALAAAELYALTKDNNYLQQASEYANIILSCQQSDMPNWEKPIRGFFYEDPAHTKLLTYEHRGHEQTPIQGLARLCEVAPNHLDYKKWLQGLKLYAEYILKTSSLVAPYNLLPAHIYQMDKLNIHRFTIPQSYGTEEDAMNSFRRQIANGIRLNEDVYLRRFPIAIQRRGFHATLLSKVKGVSLIAKLLGNEELKQVAINQLEWILGKNPFATSSMYGEGHNYHPLYVAFSRQLVGSLPVGFRTLDDHDAPHWPTINNAVYKEIWGHTTGKFLWVLVDLL